MPTVFTLCFGGTPKRKAPKRGKHAKANDFIPKALHGGVASLSPQQTYGQAVKDALADKPPRFPLNNISLAESCVQAPLLRHTCQEDLATSPPETASGGLLKDGRVNICNQGMLEELRDAMIMEVCPAMVTIFTSDGLVLHQNPSSRVYYSPRVHSSGDVLSLLFSIEPGKAERMHSELKRVGSAGLWKGVVRVPRSLSLAPLTTAAFAPTTPVLEEGDESTERGAECKVAAGLAEPRCRSQPGEGVATDTELANTNTESAGRSAYALAPAGLAAATVAATTAASVNTSGCDSLFSSQSLVRRWAADVISCTGTGAAPHLSKCRVADDGVLGTASSLDDPRVSRPFIETSGTGRRCRVVAGPGPTSSAGPGPTSSARHAPMIAQRSLSILSSQQCVQQPGPAMAGGDVGILDSTAHDPLATSTFSTLATSPALLTTGPPAIPKCASSIGIADSVGAPSSPAGSPRPARRLPRRVNSCYVTKLGDGRVSSGAGVCPSSGLLPAAVPVSGSRALAFALSLGTSPLLAVQPHLAPGSPAVRSPGVHSSLSGFRFGHVSASHQDSMIGEFQEQSESQSQAVKAAATAATASAADNSINHTITSGASRGVAGAAAPKAAHNESLSLPGETIATAAAALCAATTKAGAQSNTSSLGRFLEASKRLELCSAAVAPAPEGAGCAVAAADVAATVGPFRSGSCIGAGDGVPHAVQFLGLGSEADKEAAQQLDHRASDAAASVATVAISANGMPYIYDTDTGSEATTALAARTAEKSATASMGRTATAANLHTAAASRFGAVGAMPQEPPRSGKGGAPPPPAVAAAATAFCAAPQQSMAIGSDASLSSPKGPFSIGQVRSKVYDVQATACPAESEASGVATVVQGQSVFDASDKAAAKPSGALVIQKEERSRMIPGEHSLSGPSQCDPECWHEVWAKAARDPVTGADVIVITQMDVTAKVVAERHLALVMETEHRLVEQLFPRHILQYITEEWTAGEAPPTAEHRVEGGRQGDKITGGSLRWRPVIRDCNVLATWHPEVTLLFADIKGFTPMCKEMEPRQVMTLLNALYSRYDAMLDEFGVYKVETIGDCYFVAGGLIHEDEDGMAAVRDPGSEEDPMHAERVFMFAKAMLSAAREVVMPTTGQPVEIRIGLHTGPVVSGVVGTRMPRFCVFGDTVNTASRMESTGVPGAIHASEDTFTRLGCSDGWEPTVGIEVKGKGKMQTFLWHPPPDVPARPEAQSSQRGTSTSHNLTIKVPPLTQAASAGPVDTPCSPQATYVAGRLRTAAQRPSISFDGFTAKGAPSGIHA